MPRQINSEISTRVERAVIWAMNLHPTERPQDVETFRQALLGNWTPPITPIRRPAPPSLRAVLDAPNEQALLWIAAGLIIFSFIVTLIR